MQSKKSVHRSRIPIRWGDMDALGHVNNTVYFKYLEDARVEWMETAGLAIDSGQGPVLVNTQCSFLRQLKYPGDVEVICYSGPVGRSSFEISYEIRRVDAPDLLVAEASSKLVWVDLKQGKSMALPDGVRQLLAD